MPGNKSKEGQQSACEHVGVRGDPRYVRTLEDIARATGQTMPAEVYLVPSVNAWVSQRGGIMGLGSRRVMGLGLPLMQLLTPHQLRAVLAHEFGGWYEADVLQAADSISWLEVNQEVAQRWVRDGRCDVAWAREKHRWSFERIRLEEARELAQPYYEEALASV